MKGEISDHTGVIHEYEIIKKSTIDKKDCKNPLSHTDGSVKTLFNNLNNRIHYK